MPASVPDTVQAAALTTDQALETLSTQIGDVVKSAQNADSWSFVWSALSLRRTDNLFSPVAAVVGTLQAVLLILTHSGESWGVFQGLLLFFLVAFNFFVNLYEHYLRCTEVRRRVSHVWHRLEEVRSRVHWTSSNYPHLHTPVAASIVLQWTIRDKKHVNLPWALLVKGDHILMKPGQVAPGKCYSYDDPSVLMDQGDVLYIQTHTDDYVSPTPEFKAPASPKLFVMDETPYLQIVNQILHAERDRKPPSLLYKWAHLFFTRILVHILLPICSVVTLVWCLVRHGRTWGVFQLGPGSGFLTELVAVTLPLLSLIFPIAWLLANYTALAWVLGVYSSSRHMKMTDDPFDDNVDQPEVVNLASQMSFWSLKKYFISALLGTGEYLSRTENLVHTLGSLTALCCTDKKGILSWPNPSPEKIFMVKKEPQKSPLLRRDDDKPDPEPVLTPEILNITHDPRNPFKVEFDDPAWTSFMNYLKPLGLAILLNTCNISTEEKYTNFFNHLVCESIQVEQEHRHHSIIDMVPIVTRGCLCELSRKIGFGSRTRTQYTLSSQIQMFRHVRPNLKDKFARNLNLARLKFPFPHLVSVLVQQKATGARQLISQGTADIVLDSCTDCWSGKDLEILTEDIRKRILDFYQRASLSSYCTAFSYRPQTYPLPWRNCREYLQLPTHSNPFYWQHSDQAECLDADAITNVSHMSMGTKSQSRDVDGMKKDDYVKTKVDAMTCLEMECNQTFLGMIQLQYQAVVEVVQLIDLLEKACIRFVHFSRDSELRSRVFSEKMGLESGWNCHISLKSAEPGSTSTITCTRNNPKHSQGGKLALQRSQIGSSLPDKLNRPVWYLDFPKWQEVARGAWSNGERKMSQKMSLVPSEEDIEGKESSPPEGPDRQTSVTSDSDPFEFDMSNRAQLPRGIENIRPHLEMMDNVPLLVSLFTDCTSESTREMLKIMQEYGEVVCVMGSSANYRNIDVFLQADASLAIEPRYPQICQRVPVFLTPKAGPSPIGISQLLNSVTSSLSFKMEDEISIFHLILESRQFTLSMINVMKFWTCALASLSLLQLISVILTLPVFTTCGQTLWLALLLVPLQSLVLLGAKTDANVMNISTGKNMIPINMDSFRYAMFVPAVLILAAGHVGTAVDLANYCNMPADQVNNSTLSGHNVTSPCSLTQRHVLGQQSLNFAFYVAYMAVISISFVSRDHQVWQMAWQHNIRWLSVTPGLLLFVSGYATVVIHWCESFLQPPMHVWIMWTFGLLLVLAINEVVKRHVIKVEVRYQKRERLEFGTKLGINSPF